MKRTHFALLACLFFASSARADQYEENLKASLARLKAYSDRWTGGDVRPTAPAAPAGNFAPPAVAYDPPRVVWVQRAAAPAYYHAPQPTYQPQQWQYRPPAYQMPQRSLPAGC